MRDEAAIALVLVLVIASAGAGYFVGNSSQKAVTTTLTSTLVTHMTTTYSTTFSTTTSVFSTATQSVLAGTGCSTPVSQPPTGTNDTNLYYITAPSVASLCITYEYKTAGNASYTPNWGYLSFTGGGGSQFDTCDYPSSYLCAGITLSVSPIFAQFSGNTNVTVTYRFNFTSGLLQGLYQVFNTSKCYPTVLVYEDYNYTRINVGGVGGGPGGPGCTFPLPQPANVWVVGVSNMRVSAVPVVA